MSQVSLEYDSPLSELSADNLNYLISNAEFTLTSASGIQISEQLLRASTPSSRRTQRNAQA